MENPSLYKRIGGEAAVRATVTKLYDKLLSDDEVAPFFENSNVETLRHSQTAFVTFAFGGPNHYTGKTMRKAHEKSVTQGLTDRHFDLVTHHLKEAMQELSVPANLIAEALDIVEDTRDDVLNR